MARQPNSEPANAGDHRGTGNPAGAQNAVVPPSSPWLESVQHPLAGQDAAICKDRAIETLRGVAIILMVAAHVIGYTPREGLQVEYGSLYRFLYDATALFRLPLFTVISGYVYAMRPVAWPTAGGFLAGKFRRIALPFLAVSTIQFLARATIGGANKQTDLRDIWKIYVFGFDQFWFLQAILLVFLTIVVIDGFHGMRRPLGWLVCLAAAIALAQYGPGWSYFSFGDFTYLLPYFILGCGLNRYSELLRRPLVVWSAAAVFAIGMVLQQSAWFGRIHVPADRYSPLAACVGLGGNLLAFRIRFESALLARLGAFSYTIFLFHVFGTAGSRIVCMRMGLTDREALAAIGLLCGLALPILIDIGLRRIPIARTVFLGLR